MNFTICSSASGNGGSGISNSYGRSGCVSGTVALVVVLFVIVVSVVNNITVFIVLLVFVLSGVRQFINLHEYRLSTLCLFQQIVGSTIFPGKSGPLGACPVTPACACGLNK